MKRRIFHTVWCNISSEAAGEILNWSLMGVKGLKITQYSAQFPTIVQCPYPVFLALLPIPISRCWFSFSLLCFVSATRLTPTYPASRISSSWRSGRAGKETLPAASRILVEHARNSKVATGDNICKLWRLSEAQSLNQDFHRNNKVLTRLTRSHV